MNSKVKVHTKRKIPTKKGVGGFKKFIAFIFVLLLIATAIIGTWHYNKYVDPHYSHYDEQLKNEYDDGFTAGKESLQKQINEYLQQIEQLTAENKQKQSQVDELTTEIAEKLASINSLNAQIEELTKTNNANIQRIAELTSNVADLTGQIATLTAKISELENVDKQAVELSKQVTGLTEQVTELTAQNSNLLNTISTNSSSIDNFTKQIEQLNARIVELQGSEEEVQQLTEQVSQLTKNVQNLTEQNTTLQSTITQNNETISGLRSQIETLNGQIAELQGKDEQISDLTAQVSNLTQQVSTLTSQNENLQSTITRNEQQIESLTSEVSTLNQQVTDLTAENTQYKTTIAENEKTIKDLQAKVAELEEKLANQNGINLTFNRIFGENDWDTISFVSSIISRENMTTAQVEKSFGWKIGDEIDILVGEETATMLILGFNHDELTSGGKAGITLGMKDCLSTEYVYSSSNFSFGGWDKSEMRISTMSTLITQLSTDLQKAIKEVNKKSYDGVSSEGVKLNTFSTSSDKLWLLCEEEIWGRVFWGVAGEGTQYEYWMTVKDGSVAANRIKNSNGKACGWWLRSADNGIVSSFSAIGRDGSFSSTFSSSRYGISFCFCV